MLLLFFYYIYSNSCGSTSRLDGLTSCNTSSTCNFGCGNNTCHSRCSHSNYNESGCNPCTDSCMNSCSGGGSNCSNGCNNSCDSTSFVASGCSSSSCSATGRNIFYYIILNISLKLLGVIIWVEKERFLKNQKV